MAPLPASYSLSLHSECQSPFPGEFYRSIRSHYSQGARNLLVLLIAPVAFCVSTHPTPRTLFFFLGLCLWHMEVPRPGLKSELQLPAYTIPTATATPGPSHIFSLHHSLLNLQIFNPLSKVRNRTHILMDTS